MPDAHERRAHILSQLSGKGIDFEFVNCVVGKDLTDEEIERECDVRELNSINHTGWINRGIIGCSLTSRNIHLEIVRRDLSCALLLEDDAVLPDNFSAILNECEALVQPGDVILLFWLSSVPVTFDSSAAIRLTATELYQAPDDNRITGGSATIFSKEAAQKMADFNTPIRRTPDCWRDFYEAGCMTRILCAHPMVVDTADFMSTMGHGRFITFRKLINDYKIFPFYQVLKSRRQRMKRKRIDVSVR